MRHRTLLFRLLSSLAIPFCLTSGNALAWIYPEHRDIAGSAIAGLSQEEKAAIEKLWTEARKGQESRLCESPWAGDQGPKPTCIDWAAFPAISGDHACSVNELLTTVLESKWILPVAGICSRLEKDLAEAKNPVELRNQLVKSDLWLERTDPEYATRAGASNLHFLLARASGDAREYMQNAIKAAAEPNAIGLWVRAHSVALRFAAELGSGTVPEAERPAMARAALATEAFGLHFLEDSFASGHLAGCWGDVATRKGTHDYYNEKGLSTHTWGGEDVVLTGDARMRKEDLERAAPVIRQSIAQMLQTLDPATNTHASSLAIIPIERAFKADSFNACQAKTMPDSPPLDENLRKAFAEILWKVPAAARSEGIGSLPRFRSEMGPFLGLASGFRGAFSSGSLDAETSSGRLTGALDLGVRAGLGLDGVLTDMGDGQIFLQVGLNYQAKQKKTCEVNCGTVEGFKSLFPQMPARTGVTTRLRLPFWLLPFDLIYTAPILLVSPKSYEKMAIQAANGGLIPWQSGIDTALGRLQFCAGREVGVTFFGYVGGEDQLLVSTDSGSLVAVSLRSIEVEVSFVELRPLRTFATTQRATLLFQIGGGMDIPSKVTALYPVGALAPDLKTTYFGYIKLAFDWRGYL
jgi:hypothetical protein